MDPFWRTSVPSSSEIAFLEPVLDERVQRRPHGANAEQAKDTDSGCLISGSRNCISFPNRILCFGYLKHRLQTHLRLSNNGYLTLIPDSRGHPTRTSFWNTHFEMSENVLSSARLHIPLLGLVPTSGFPLPASRFWFHSNTGILEVRHLVDRKFTCFLKLIRLQLDVQSHMLRYLNAVPFIAKALPGLCFPTCCTSATPKTAHA